MSQDRKLGVRSGVAIVVSNMIGAGVFISTGFMAQTMGPGIILLAWVVGGVIAFCGARAYATAARLVPRSGGEYRFLSEFWHPFVGFLAGWCSLLLGFSAPIAVDAFAAGDFLKTLGVGLDPRYFGALLVVLLTVVHAIGLHWSKWAQNLLVVVNGVLIAGFIVLGLALGNNHWPAWTPPEASAGFPLASFMANLFYIAFAFSGWNAVVYAAEDFREPRRTVPRAMLVGCLLVGVVYLLVNWVFVANLTPDQAKVVFDYDTARVTLGHLITRGIAGEAGARAMSVLAIVAFTSAMSAMMFAGPRVYAAMAREGFLPHVLAGEEGKPPLGSVVLQGAFALVLIFTHELQQVLQNVGAVLTLFSALTALGLFRVRFGRRWADEEPPRISSLVAAAVFVAFAAWMLYFGVRNSRETHLLLWLGAIFASAAVSYGVARAVRQREA